MKYTSREKRIRRHARIRSRVSGSLERPRIVVSRTNRYMFVQLIDDQSGTTIVGMHDHSLASKGTKLERAQALGKEIALKAKEKGITTAVFDRGGFRFTGRVRAVAEGARAAGLQF